MANYYSLMCGSVVEELFKRREPMPGMDAIYFIQPTKEKYPHTPFSHFCFLIPIISSCLLSLPCSVTALLCFYQTCLGGNPCTGSNNYQFSNHPFSSLCIFLFSIMSLLYLFSRAYIFFSSTIPKELVNHIKSDSSVLPRIGALREVNAIFTFLALIAVSLVTKFS